MILGLITLFTSFIFALISFIKNQAKFYNWNGLLQLSLKSLYLVITSALLGVLWIVNVAIIDELGALSPLDKMNIVLGKTDVNEKEIQQLIKDYPELKRRNITFKYPPNAEDKVHDMISKMGDIEQLELEIFGYQLPKTKNLEVIILPTYDEYIQARPSAGEREAGSYTGMDNRAILYEQPMDINGDEPSLSGIFGHEYGHYLMDMFLVDKEIKFDDVPAWYHEGISEYIGNQVGKELKFPGNVSPDLTFDHLQSLQEWKDAATQSDVYYFAGKTIEYVIGSADDSIILSDIVLNTKVTGTFDESFKQLTGLDPKTLNITSIHSVEEDLDEARILMQESDFKKAEEYYKKILKKHPREPLAWHQYALMLEKQKRWDEAISARQIVTSIEPDNPNNYMYLSYLLTVIDSQEAVNAAEKALELVKKENRKDGKFHQKWIDEISYYNELIKEKKYAEAYQSISQSDQLSTFPEIVEELSKIRK
ncbi:type IV pilus biogenesis/stability protein PilW [Sporosarcina sp. BI001-red]|uniref:tetratricopeptide repeat protein n=1 Tax=Sporosarcina sp. BI001-red TaxID=2282866 RepID=UPI0011C06224|nr:tetratricopeptide repeat protein [Sporosarcina sp. BI001-red]